MNYNEIAKIFNEQGWKLNHILLGFSIAILAFSIQTLEKNISYNLIIVLYTSWGTFFTTIVLGLLRFHIMQQTMKLQAKKAYDHEVTKRATKPTTYEIQKKSQQSHFIYIFMWITFFIGLFLFAIFKISNIA
jgi:hypothetical protein